MSKQNPFSLTSNISPKHFISRESETERIIGAITNNRNITLIARSGLGKTSLIHNVFNELKELDSYQSVYLDVSSVANINNFVNVLINALIENDIIKLKKKTKFVLDKIEIEKHVDFLTNYKSFSVKVEGDQEIFNILEEVFGNLNSYNKKIVIAFDEFDSLVSSVKNPLITFVIKLINNSKNISYIFSGNNIERLQLLFRESNNEEIKYMEKLQIDPLEKKKYKNFISKKFLKNKIIINDESLEFILEWSRLNTYCVHLICNLIYEKKPKKVKVSLVKEIINSILTSKSHHYFSYKKLLSQYQWKLLKSIATEGEANYITSSHFINKYKLNAPSSVKTAITALIEKGLVYRVDKTYKICDIFLERWMIK